MAGCLADTDCKRHQKCQDEKCVSLTCPDSQGLIQQGSIVLDANNSTEIGASGTLNCKTGHVYVQGNDLAKSVEVVCAMSNPEARWVVNNTGDIIRPCQTGCITDCDCPNGEYCEDESKQCAPTFCHIQYLGELVHRIPSTTGQNPTVTVNSTAHLKCSKQGNIFKSGSSTVKAVCVSHGSCQKGFSPKYINEATGEDVEPCSPGCGHDSDCLAEDMCGKSGKCQPIENQCTSYTNDDNYSSIEKASGATVKVCQDKYRFHDGKEKVNITCVGNQWVTTEGWQVPRCCQCPEDGPCRGHCPDEVFCPQDQVIHHGRMKFLYGNVVGARALVSCDGGFHINGYHICRHSNVAICTSSPYGRQWTGRKTNELMPTCDKIGFGRCCSATDCDISQECKGGFCIKRQCASRLSPSSNGFLEKKHSNKFEIGQVAVFLCYLGFYNKDNPLRNSMDVICYQDKILGQKWKGITGEPLVACQPGCALDTHCKPWQFCNVKLEECQDNVCPISVEHGQVIKQSEKEATIFCNEGYLSSDVNQQSRNVTW